MFQEDTSKDASMNHGITSVIFLAVMIGSIFLAAMASENNNMTKCWLWLSVTAIAIIVRLAV
jgi:hypothetical protein